jgi:predicted nucleotidyltransferase/HEPN domain-containing protein
LDLADGENPASLSAVEQPLASLPQGKQDELAFVVDVIRSGFAHATTRRTQPHLRAARLLKILLFGSYARGTWVDDPVGRYFSDYDLLIVVNHDDLTDYAEYWEKIDRRLIDAGAAGTRLRTQVSLAPHSLDDINEKLRLGRYFFVDAVRDGIVLFEEEGHPFAESQPLTAQQALDETRSFFEAFFASANEFVDNYRFNLGLRRTNNAAFQLHQAAERAYHCLLLVRTLYSPKTHKLTKLRAMAEDYEPRLRAVWPNENRSERRAYGLLVDAYVKALLARIQHRYRAARLARLARHLAARSGPSGLDRAPLRTRNRRLIRRQIGT